MLLLITTIGHGKQDGLVIGGGGSGGSIYIDCSIISGYGLIQASGGNGAPSYHVNILFYYNNFERIPRN